MEGFQGISRLNENFECCSCVLANVWITHLAFRPEGDEVYQEKRSLYVPHAKDSWLQTFDD